MIVVFDLDGVLIDSEELIRNSYIEAGVKPPDNFLSIGNHDWLRAACPDSYASIHARKDFFYLRDLWRVPFLPAWKTAELLAERGVPVSILTGAPEGTVRLLRSFAPSWPFVTGVDGSWPAAKERWLQQHRGTGVYVDDQEHVNVPDNWKFVHYTGQSAADLFSEVTL